MTDAPDEPSGVQPDRTGGRRGPRVGDSGSPVSSTLSIILAVVAVIAGFLILRAITDDDGPAATDPDATAGDISVGPTTTGTFGSVEGATTLAQGSGVTTTAAPTLTGATIVVANASGVGGSAAAMSTALQTAGFATVGEPGNATGEQLVDSVVYYAATDPAAQAVAESIGTAMGGVAVEALPDPVPADGGQVAEATVLVMLGSGQANKTLAELAGGAASSTGDTSVAPPAIVTPPTTSA